MTVSANVLDRWILSRLHASLSTITAGYEAYDTPAIVNMAWNFMQDLSLWYIRRSRDRVGPTSSDTEDKNVSYETIWVILIEFTKALAPLIPFVTEEIYKNLTGEESVHLASWTENIDKLARDTRLEKEMDRGRKLASVVHAFRKEHSIKVRIPLKALDYKGSQELTVDVEKVVLDEVNVNKLIYKGQSEKYSISGDTSEKNQDLVAGEAREIVRSIQAKRKELGVKITDYVSVTLPSWPKEHEEWIKKQTLAKALKVDKTFTVLP